MTISQLADVYGLPVETKIGGGSRITRTSEPIRPDLAAMLAQTPANAIAILKSTGGSVGRNLQG